MKKLISILAALAAMILIIVVATMQPFVMVHSSGAPPANQERLKTTVRHLSETLYPRSFDQPAKLAAAGAFVKDAFVAAGGRVSEQEVIVQGERFSNIIARFGPEFGPESGPVLVIGAHYDSHGDAVTAAKSGKKYSGASHTPGADDNASGVAGLIELAHMLGKSAPRRPVELVAYTLEEPPHFRTQDMGSARHAQLFKSRERSIELMISLEMIGYFSDAPDSQDFPVPGMGLIYPTTGNFIAVVSRWQDWQQTRRLKAVMAGASNLPIYSINTFPAIPGVDLSDHLNYWALDIPAIMVTDTAFNRNKAYHEAGDTYDRLDYARMAKVVQGVYAFAINRN